MIRLQERRIERNKRFFKNQRVSVVQEGEPFRGPLRPRPVTKAFSRRANHQFTLVVLINITCSTLLLNKVLHYVVAFCNWLIILSARPVPIATDSSGFSAIVTGTTISSDNQSFKLFKSAPPPVIIMPWSTMSPLSSGGQFSNVRRMPSSILSNDGLIALYISVEIGRAHV